MKCIPAGLVTLFPLVLACSSLTEINALPEREEPEDTPVGGQTAEPMAGSVGMTPTPSQGMQPATPPAVKLDAAAGAQAEAGTTRPPTSMDAGADQTAGTTTPAAPSGVSIMIQNMAVPREKAVVFIHLGHSNMAGRASGPTAQKPYFYDPPATLDLLP